MTKQGVRTKPEQLRMYNLLPPKAGQGMKIKPRDFANAAEALKWIRAFARKDRRRPLIVVGGRSDRMAMVALTLKLLLPKHGSLFDCF